MNLPNMALMKPSMIVRPFECENYNTNENEIINLNNINKLENMKENKKNIFRKVIKILTNWIENILNIKWRFNIRRSHLRCWGLGLAIYLTMILLAEGDPDELLTEEDHISLREWVKENDEVMRSEYKARSELAHEVCDQYDVYISNKEFISSKQQLLDYSDWLALKRVNWNYIYYVPAHDFVYCKVPKSGSSTWVYNLLKLTKVPENLISSDIGLHKILRDYYPQVSSSKMKKVFKKSFKLSVVRHPFDRILSAYRDKMEDYQRDLKFRDGYYHTMYGKNIVRVYRDESDKTLTNRTEPTWLEFVRYIINTPASKFDEHWKPIYMLCSPCVLKYDVIAKMDTFSEDTQFVIDQLGLEDELHVEWIHRTSKSKTSELIKKYFSQITEKQLDQLYAKYHLDFELFGFNYDSYRELLTAE